MPDDNDLINKLETLLQQQKEVLKKLESIEKPVFVQEGDKKRVLRVPEVCFITTNPKGLDIYTTNNKKYINFDSISGMAEEFKDDVRLMKTHKSFIVNLDLIDTVNVIPGGRELTFKGLPADITAKVTSDALTEFEQRFGNT